ncbi:hypothetical protein BKA64DRAFT_645372 [Cadophora sp. MPI-SDFR-AT-0126]|nr:hypothetical protein BKA64DRAFT_645372 [Leotiomycetes sp. MPI-SDFR-AT-0126]
MLALSELMFALSLCIIASIALYLLRLPGRSWPPPCPSRFLVPRPSTPPIDTTSTPYSEDAIITLLNEIYTLLLKLAYLPPKSVIFAPPNGHKINVTLCESLHIDPAVISLMKWMPYTDYGMGDSEELEYPCFGGGWMYNFLRNEQVLRSRDPERNAWSDEPRTDYLLPCDVALTEAEDPDLEWLVLDTRQKLAIRHMMKMQLERPDEPNHYRNAVSFLRAHLERIRSLDLLPFTWESRQGFLDFYHHLHYPLKKILTEEYGWPGEFRTEDWARDKAGVWQKFEREHEEWEQSVGKQ